MHPEDVAPETFSVQAMLSGLHELEMQQLEEFGAEVRTRAAEQIVLMREMLCELRQIRQLLERGR